MSRVRIHWGRIVVFFTLLTSLVGYATYDRWRDRLVGTPLETAPALISQGLAWVKHQTDVLLGRLVASRRDPVETLAHWYPADTIGFAVVKDLDAMLFALSAALGDATPTVQRRSRERLGIDLTSAGELAATGFDFARPWGLGIVPTLEGQDPALVALLPVRDARAALQTVQQALARSSLPLLQTEAGGLTAYVLEERIALAHAAGDHLAVVSSGSTAQTSLEALARFNTGAVQPLDDATWFQRMLEVQGRDWKGLIFASRPGLEAGLTRNGAEDAQRLRDVLPLAMSLGFGAEDTCLWMRTAFSEPARPWKQLLEQRGGADRFAERLSGAALAAGHFQIDFDSLIELLRQDAGLGTVWEDFKRDQPELGWILEDDLLRNLEGPVAGAALQESSALRLDLSSLQGAITSLAQSLGEKAAEVLPVAFVTWTRVKDDDRMAAALQALASHAPAGGKGLVLEPGDEDQLWYGFPGGGLGLVESHLVTSFGPGGLSALRERLTTGKKSFLESLPTDAMRAWKAGHPAWFYVDTRNVLQAASESVWFKSVQLTPGTGAARQAVESVIRGLSATTHLERELVITDYVLHGPEEGFSSRSDALREALKAAGG